VLGIRIVVRGDSPRSGLLVANHLSYIDIIVLSSITPCVFVAKRDVAGWPLFGWLACAAGTIFVDRKRKLAASAAVEQVRDAINDGALVVIFPEGTSSDGVDVLPFKSALLEPALQVGCQIAVAAIDYALPHGGSVADEVCYWRDMTLVPHLLNLFAKPAIEVRLSLSSFQSCGDRKQVARELRDQIVRLRS
jgi:1-acyl-sn-glycerol-3-phosphate acyltransferase